MAKETQAATQRGVLTVRLPAELHEGLRTYKLYANRPINDVVVELIRDFLDGPGREEIARGMTERARSMYGVALDKLEDM